MPVELQSVFRNNGLIASNCVSNGDVVILFFSDKKIFDISGVHAGEGITPLKRFTLYLEHRNEASVEIAK